MNEYAPKCADILAQSLCARQVCDEQRCEEQVFPLAINYMDRFLCLCPIAKNQFQLLGAVCLLMATKIRQCYALTADLLCAYTEYSVTADEIRVSWPLNIECFGWVVFCVRVRVCWLAVWYICQSIRKR